MRAADTSVLVRLLVGDDAAQTRAAEAFLTAGTGIWILHRGSRRDELGAHCGASLAVLEDSARIVGVATALHRLHAQLTAAPRGIGASSPRAAC